MDNQSLTTQALGKSIMLALMIIPTAVSIFVALEVKDANTIVNQAFNSEPQIVCFDPDVCAIEVQGKWYRISGVISMEQTVPEEYRLDELVEEATKDRAEQIITTVDEEVKNNGK